MRWSVKGHAPNTLPYTPLSGYLGHMPPDTSELIGAINYYRTALDVATAIVVVGLIGEYFGALRSLFAALWSRSFRVAGRRFVSLVFPLMVVGGVAGELWVNLRVSGLENKWEAAQLPRDLSAKQQKEITDKISKFDKTPFDLSVHQELEPMRLLDKIEDALLAANWQEQPADSRVTHFNRIGRPPVALRTVGGVWIAYAERSQDSIKDAANALIEALRDADIVTRQTVLIPGGDADAGAVHVWVGGKP